MIVKTDVEKKGWIEGRTNTVEIELTNGKVFIIEADGEGVMLTKKIDPTNSPMLADVGGEVVIS